MQGKFEDLTGRKYGRWEVLTRAPNSTSRQAYWYCKCTCGVKKAVAASNLLRGWSISCGCYNKEVVSKRPYESLYNSLRRTSRERGKTCALTYNQFLTFVKKTACHYCGNPVVWTKNSMRFNGYGYNLDRKDNTQGYSKENCVVCCKVCNRMKYTLSLAEFTTHIKKIARRLCGRL